MVQGYLQLLPRDASGPVASPHGAMAKSNMLLESSISPWCFEEASQLGPLNLAKTMLFEVMMQSQASGLEDIHKTSSESPSKGFNN